MDLFKEYFRSHRPQLSIKAVNRRHRQPIPGKVDALRKHANIVPQKYISNNQLNKKIETLKQRPGRFVCDKNDLNYIVSTFLHGRQPNPNELKMLGGKLGIKFYHDKNLNKWVMEKQ